MAPPLELFQEVGKPAIDQLSCKGEIRADKKVEIVFRVVTLETNPDSCSTRFTNIGGGEKEVKIEVNGQIDGPVDDPFVEFLPWKLENVEFIRTVMDDGASRKQPHHINSVIARDHGDMLSFESLNQEISNAAKRVRIIVAKGEDNHDGL